jgi:hypothetical protein
MANGADEQAASKENGNPASKTGKRRRNRANRDWLKSKARTRVEYPILKSIPKQGHRPVRYRTIGAPSRRDLSRKACAQTSTRYRL